MIGLKFGNYNSRDQKARKKIKSETCQASKPCACIQNHGMDPCPVHSLQQVCRTGHWENWINLTLEDWSGEGGHRDCESKLMWDENKEGDVGSYQDRSVDTKWLCKNSQTIDKSNLIASSWSEDSLLRLPSGSRQSKSNLQAIRVKCDFSLHVCQSSHQPLKSGYCHF